jgi:hypothetical protein
MEAATGSLDERCSTEDLDGTEVRFVNSELQSTQCGNVAINDKYQSPIHQFPSYEMGNICSDRASK